MTGDKLSKSEDRALHRALASIVLTQYPNPERKDCPGTSVLRAIATKSIPMRHPAHEPVGSCSPCFSELTEIRDALHRLNLMWAMGTAGAAVLVIAVVAYFAFLRVNSPVSQEAVHSVTAGGPSKTSELTPNSSLSQPGYDEALLDLRNATTSRTIQSSGSTLNG